MTLLVGNMINFLQINPLSVIQLWIILISLFHLHNSFQFSPPSIIADPTTINTLSVYQISIDRAYTQSLIETRWSLQQVPTGSNISVDFPVEYSFTVYQPKLESVLIDYLEVLTSQLILVPPRTLVITNAILASASINNVIITVSNIMNPSPAKTTDDFMAKIGTDTSQTGGSSSSVVSLSADTFKNCAMSFTPSFTNTTGGLVLNVQPKTSIPISGSLIIDFPITLQWSQDISTNNPLPLDKVGNCSVVSTEITSVLCSGSKTTHQIYISFISTNSSVIISQAFQVTINGLFSPPTINPPDQLKISSFTTQLYGLDICQSKISGLKPQVLTVLLEYSLNPLYIDTLTTLTFNFSNTDTIAKDDYFQIVFPTSTTITFVRLMSNLNPTNSTYNSSTLALRFYQLSSSNNVFSGTSNYIRFLNYRSPLTINQTDSIYLTVYSSGGFKKMQGSTKIKATQKSYTILAQSSDNLYINQQTKYYLTINISNTVTSKAMLKITIPKQLKFKDSTTACPTVNTTVSTSNCTSSPNDTLNIIVTNLWTTTAPTGQQLITLYNMINPGYSTNLSSFKIQLFYNESQDYLVAQYTSSLLATDILTILPVKINQLSLIVNLSSYKVFQKNVTYTIDFQVSNQIPDNGIIDIYFPITPLNIFSPGSALVCKLIIQNITLIKNCTPIISTKSIRIFVNSTLTDDKISPSNIRVIIQDCCSNPYSTRPIVLPNIQTKTSSLNLIQYLSNSITIIGFKQLTYKSNKLTRTSDKNTQLNEWNISLEQYQSVNQDQGIVEITFQWSCLVQVTQVAISSGSSKFNTAYNITNQNQTIAIVIPLSLINYANYSVSIKNVTNPPTFQPLSYTMITKTVDGYLYAKQTFTITPTTTPSAFLSFNYSFSPKILGQFSTLSMVIQSLPQNQNQINKFTLANLSQYMQGNKSLQCNDPNLELNCTLSTDNNTLSIMYINSSQIFTNPFNLKLNNIYVRPTVNFTTMTLRSYSLNGYLTSQFSKLDFGPLCKLPCRQCVSDLFTSQCTSCFDNVSIAIEKYLFNQTCYFTCPNSTVAVVNANLTYPNVCQNCSTQCLTCSIVKNNCTSCNVTSTFKYYYLNSCIQQCPIGTYPNVTLNNSLTTVNFYTCILCTSTCKSCYSSISCTSCAADYFLFVNTTTMIGTCLQNCPQNITVKNLTTFTCDYCQKQCSICQNLTTTCLACSNVPNTTIKYLLIQDQYTCVSTCPSTRVLDKTLAKCVVCESPCQTCDKIENNCTSCTNGTFLSAILKNSCLAQCQPLYFKNTTSSICQLCSSVVVLNCKNCSSSINCLECDRNSGFVFFPQNSSCLSFVPQGYVNISGVAVKCTNNCTQCIQTQTKCTKCSGLYFLYLNQCILDCTQGYIGFNNTCAQCQGSCQDCQFTLTNCTKCYTPYYFLNNTVTTTISTIQNKCVIKCPDTYFLSSFNVSEPGKTCIKCELPCVNCNSLSYCQTCLVGYAYQGICYNACPNSTVGDPSKMICIPCASPCVECKDLSYNCLSCIQGYYVYAPYMRCYLPSDCPVNYSIANTPLKQCKECESPCLTCVNITSQCRSCIQNDPSTNYYLYQTNNSCLSTCPLGYYPYSAKCTLCPSECKSCSSQSLCTKCSTGYYLYQFKCLTKCPVQFSIISSINQCTQCKSYCFNCSSLNYCYQCDSSTILYQGDCITLCPSALIYYYNSSDNKRYCITSMQSAGIQLQSTLQFKTILPLPFLIISSIIFLAAIMSRIQYKGTYSIGWAYVIFGLAEVGSLGYFFYKFYFMKYKYQEILTDQKLQYNLLVDMIIGCLGLVAGLNFISLTCGSYYLTEDKIFQEWTYGRKRKNNNQVHNDLHLNHNHNHNHNSNINQSQQSLSVDAQTAQQSSLSPPHSQTICCQPLTSYLLITIISFITTFKLKLILFTRLFDLYFFSAKLQNVQKFRMFNTMTMIGLLYQALGMYVVIKVIMNYGEKYKEEIMFTAVDCLVLLILNAIVGLASMDKDQEFFNEENYQDQIEKQVDINQKNKNKNKDNNKNNGKNRDKNRNNDKDKKEDDKTLIKKKKQLKKSINDSNSLDFSKNQNQDINQAISSNRKFKKVIQKPNKKPKNNKIINLHDKKDQFTPTQKRKQLGPYKIKQQIIQKQIISNQNNNKNPLSNIKKQNKQIKFNNLVQVKQQNLQPQQKLRKVNNFISKQKESSPINLQPTPYNNRFNKNYKKLKQSNMKNEQQQIYNAIEDQQQSPYKQIQKQKYWVERINFQQTNKNRLDQENSQQFVVKTNLRNAKSQNEILSRPYSKKQKLLHHNIMLSQIKQSSEQNIKLHQQRNKLKRRQFSQKQGLKQIKKIRQWQPVIYEQKRKRQMLTHYDLVELFNPKIDLNQKNDIKNKRNVDSQNISTRNVQSHYLTPTKQISPKNQHISSNNNNSNKSPQKQIKRQQQNFFPRLQSDIKPRTIFQRNQDQQQSSPYQHFLQHDDSFYIPQPQPQNNNKFDINIRGTQQQLLQSQQKQQKRQKKKQQQISRKQKQLNQTENILTKSILEDQYQYY